MSGLRADPGGSALELRFVQVQRLDLGCHLVLIDDQVAAAVLRLIRSPGVAGILIGIERGELGARPERGQRRVVEHPVILIERRQADIDLGRVDRLDLALDLRHQPAIVAGERLVLLEPSGRLPAVDAEMLESGAGFDQPALGADILAVSAGIVAAGGDQHMDRSAFFPPPLDRRSEPELGVVTVRREDQDVALRCRTHKTAPPWLPKVRRTE